MSLFALRKYIKLNNVPSLTSLSSLQDPATRGKLVAVAGRCSLKLKHPQLRSHLPAPHAGHMIPGAIGRPLH